MTTSTPEPQMTEAQLRRHISQEVRVAMLRQGIDQRSLAEQLQIRRSTLSDRLTGKTEFGTTELYRIAQILDVDVWEFYPAADSAIAN